MEISYTLEFSDFRRFAWFIQQSALRDIKLRILFGLSLVLGLLLAFLEFWVLQKPVLESMVFYLAVGVLTLILAVVPLMNLQLRRIYKSSRDLQGDIKLTFQPDYLESAGAFSAGKFDWKGLHKIVETKADFYLFISQNQAIIIPRHKIEPEVAEALSDFLERLADATNVELRK
jgi:hypothetical protein